jgi:Zn-finger protein
LVGGHVEKCNDCRHKEKCRGIEKILKVILNYEYELAQMKVEEVERIRERILKLGEGK